MKPRNSIILLVGTQKGGFLLTSDQDRKKWEVQGPFLEGSTVVHMVLDPRDNRTIFAATSHLVWGSHIQRSQDFGKTWEVPKESPKFPTGLGLTVNSIWEIKPGREGEPGTFYAGIEPAALFKSQDEGNTWIPVEALLNHPTRHLWQPAKGGLSLHSIILDPTRPQRMFVGISAGGVFRTDDGGYTWQAVNRGVRADYLPNPFPEAGQCVHKLASHPKSPEVLYQQNHCGVYRSRDAGSSWEDISEGLPSRYGLPIAVHAHDPETIYVVPEESDQNRVTVGGRFRVYRSRNGGQTWEAGYKGLPQENAYLHVLREALVTDACDPCGVYVGTKGGHLFYSRDEGVTWEILAEWLPPIYSLSTGFIEKG